MSGADIKAMCTEAGLLALRDRRMRVGQADFVKGKENVLYKKQDGAPAGNRPRFNLFGGCLIFFQKVTYWSLEQKGLPGS